MSKITFAQIFAEVEAIPGLIAEVKAVAPDVAPILRKIAGMMGAPESRALLDEVNTVVAMVKAAAPKVAPLLVKVAEALEALEDAPQAAPGRAPAVDIAGGTGSG